MLVSIHQPQFMPWLGYFDKMDRADAFVLLDTVQFKKNEWQNRNRIKTARGPMWLTVPVRFRFPARIDAVTVNHDVPWPRKHLQALRTNYAGSAHWETHADALEALYAGPAAELARVNADSIAWLAERLGVDTEVHRASSLPVTTEEPTQRLVDLCRELDASAYLSGPDGRNYLDVARFSAAGIDVIFHEYEHPEYPQLFGAFLSHLSALDLVLNLGPDAGDVLRRGRVETGPATTQDES